MLPGSCGVDDVLKDGVVSGAVGQRQITGMVLQEKLHLRRLKERGTYICMYLALENYSGKVFLVLDSVSSTTVLTRL